MSRRITWVQEDGDRTGSRSRVAGSSRTSATGALAPTYRLEVDPGRILGIAIRGPVVGVLRGRMVESMPGKLKAFVEVGSA